MHFKRFRLGKNLKVVCSSHEKTTFWVKKKTCLIHQTEKGSNETEKTKNNSYPRCLDFKVRRGERCSR